MVCLKYSYSLLSYFYNQLIQAIERIIFCDLLTILFLFYIDSRGVPRCITNSKGRKRKPGSKTLSQSLRCNDTLFIDFVSKCLE